MKSTIKGVAIIATVIAVGIVITKKMERLANTQLDIITNIIKLTELKLKKTMIKTSDGMRKYVKSIKKLMKEPIEVKDE